VQITVTLRPALLINVYTVMLHEIFELSIGTLSLVSPSIPQSLHMK